MNDDPSSSTAAAASHHDPETVGEPAASAEEQHAKHIRLFSRKRIELLNDLIRNVDILVYAELSIIYYMDCSFLKFLIRSVLHLLFLTPKPDSFPEPPPNRPYLGVIFGGNVLAALLHAWYDPPSAGETTQGYLHGGLAMDFIGQKGPASKSILILLDIFVAVLQLVQLSALFTRQRLKAAVGGAVVDSGEAAGTDQDLDSEERGVRRAHQDQDIELQTLNGGGQVESTAEAALLGADEGEEHASMLDASLARSDAIILDAFHSGQIILTNLNTIGTIKQQLAASSTPAPEASESARQLRASIASRLIHMRFGGAHGRTETAAMPDQFI